MPFPELNLKQAWLIPSAVALPNPNGTAPGWFVGRPDGRVIVALPGPPREMRPMWADEVAAPAAASAASGAEVARRTYRLAGIGESQVAERLGEALLRADQPDRRDVRPRRGGRRPDLGRRPRPRGRPTQLVEAAAATVLERVGEHVWATGDDDLERGDRRPPRRARLDAGGRRDRDRREPRRAARRRAVGPLRRVASPPDAPGRDRPTAIRRRCRRRRRAADDGPDDLVRFARRARELGGADVGLAVRARPRTGDTAVSIAVVDARARAHGQPGACS